MNPSKLRGASIDLAIWKWEGMVLHGGTSEDYKHWAKRHIDVDVGGNPHAAAHAFIVIGKPWLIWLHSLKNIPALAHEALHITTGMLEMRGLTLNDASEEAYTYTMESIIHQVLACKKWQIAK